MRNMQSGDSRGRYSGGWTILRPRFVPAALVLIGIVAQGLSLSPGWLAFAGPVAPGDHESGKHETRKATGLVANVEAGQITIQSKDGATLVLTTFEDYRDRVTVGSEVTAVYYPQDSGNPVLKSLDYPAEVMFVPGGAISAHVHKIALLPNSQIPDADMLYDSVTDYLKSSIGWYVAPTYLTEEVSRRAQGGSMLSAMDPRTGDFDMAAYLKHSDSVIATVASGTRSDAVLELDVIRVEAQVDRLLATWDGVDEPVAGRAVRTLDRFSMFPHRGELPAATVELKLWDAKGNLLWRNRRGLALLEVMNGKGTHLEDRPLPVALGDSERMQHWMEAAFKSIGAVPASR